MYIGADVPLDVVGSFKRVLADATQLRLRGDTATAAAPLPLARSAQATTAAATAATPRATGGTTSAALVTVGAPSGTSTGSHLSVAGIGEALSTAIVISGKLAALALVTGADVAGRGIEWCAAARVPGAVVTCDAECPVGVAASWARRALTGSRWEARSSAHRGGKESIACHTSPWKHRACPRDSTFALPLPPPAGGRAHVPAPPLPPPVRRRSTSALISRLRPADPAAGTAAAALSPETLAHLQRAKVVSQIAVTVSAGLVAGAAQTARSLAAALTQAIMSTEMGQRLAESGETEAGRAVKLVAASGFVAFSASRRGRPERVCGIRSARMSLRRDLELRVTAPLPTFPRSQLTCGTVWSAPR